MEEERLLVVERGKDNFMLLIRTSIDGGRQLKKGSREECELEFTKIKSAFNQILSSGSVKLTENDIALILKCLNENALYTAVELVIICGLRSALPTLQMEACGDGMLHVLAKFVDKVSIPAILANLEGKEVMRMLEKNDDNGNTVFHSCLNRNSEEVVYFLDTIYVKLQKYQKEFLDFARRKNAKGYTVLQSIVSNNQVEIFKELIKNSQMPCVDAVLHNLNDLLTEEEENVLHICKSRQMLTCLFTNPNKGAREAIMQHNSKGCTPLHIACSGTDASLVLGLLAEGADPKALIKGNSNVTTIKQYILQP